MYVYIGTQHIHNFATPNAHVYVADAYYDIFILSPCALKKIARSKSTSVTLTEKRTIGYLLPLVTAIYRQIAISEYEEEEYYDPLLETIRDQVTDTDSPLSDQAWAKLRGYRSIRPPVCNRGKKKRLILSYCEMTCIPCDIGAFSKD